MQAGPDYAEGLINKMSTVIRRDPHQGDATHKTAHSASLGQRLRRRLPGSPHPKPSDSHSPPNGPISSVLASSAGWANRRSFSFIIIALVAALAVGLSLWLSGTLVQAQSAQMVVDYPENGEAPVATFTAADPEGVSPIVWDLLEDASGEQNLGIFTDDGRGTGQADDNIDDSDDDVGPQDVVDHPDFSISQDGVLTFKSPPDYDEASDRQAGTGDLEEAADDNTYRVVVQASDGGSASFVNWFKVTVNVTDMEEGGKVTWTVDADGGDPHTAGTPSALLQFQPGASLEASVTDDDTPVTNVRWQWYRSSSSSALGTAIGAATDDVYTVQDTSGNSDVGMYLRAVATYSDNRGPNKTAYRVSDYPVQDARDDNTAPQFASTAQTREIVENSSGNIGAAITATDADGDVLNYVMLPDAETDAGEDNDKFSLNQRTGQLTVTGSLNFEVPTDEGTSLPAGQTGGTAGDNVYEVTLRAVDSSGADSAFVTVHITVTDENEQPNFAVVEGRNIAGPAPDHAEEGGQDDYTQDITIYQASDPEGGEVEFSLTGPDAGDFELNNVAADATDCAAPNFCKTLAFSGKPDFESPADSNRDNVYDVTVRASDGVTQRDRRVTVKVTDTDETGQVELSAQDALIGVELEATLMDSDGGVPATGTFTDMSWQWLSLVAANTELDSTVENAVIEISGATANTYTPASADRGRFLRAQVSYTDRTRDEDNDPETNDADDNFVGFTQTVTSDPTTAVRNNPQNQRPVFADGARVAKVVAENTKALAGDAGDADADDDAETTDNPADNVGGTPIVATDADGDTPTYTLSGADAGMFRVRDNGQLEVSSSANLDYEKSRTHTITMTADDGFGGANSTASITVTIHVTDLDEAPVITDRDDASAAGQQQVSFKENTTDHVVRLTARDPEGVTPIVWSFLEDATGTQDLGIFTDVDGTPDQMDDSDDDVGTDDVVDYALFDIGQDGVLTYKSAPDFVEGGDNEHRVVVQASDGGQTAQLNWFKVTVDVTDEEEDGKVSWTVDPDGAGTEPANQNLLQFNASAVLTASQPTDPDGGVTNVAWQWYRSTSKTAQGTAISGADTPEYTVVDSPTDPNDRGKYLRVVATYEDERGPNKTAAFVSEYPVQRVLGEENDVPAFATASVARRIVENTSGDFGSPVTASDADGDVLNYALTDDNTDDNEKFAIDQKTGQLSVTEDLDFENPQDEGTGHPTPGETGTAGDNIYQISVMATDSSGADTATPIVVYITVTDENEEPVFGTIATDGTPPPAQRNTKGTAPDHAEEGVDSADYTRDVALYTAWNPEGGNIDFTLMGADAGDFELTERPSAIADCPEAGRPSAGTTANATVHCKVLAFASKPDFEDPADSNTDNVYAVIVRASDGQKYTDRAVTVKVTDTDEAGMVMLSSQDAEIGVELTATLTDSDGGVPTEGTFTDIEWQWWRWLAICPMRTPRWSQTRTTS